MTDCCTRCRRIGEMKLRSMFDGDAAIDHPIKFQLCDQCLAYFRALRAHDAESEEQQFASELWRVAVLDGTQGGTA
jgi:hypothetical protein